MFALPVGRPPRVSQVPSPPEAPRTTSAPVWTDTDHGGAHAGLRPERALVGGSPPYPESLRPRSLAGGALCVPGAPSPVLMFAVCRLGAAQNHHWDKCRRSQDRAVTSGLLVFLQTIEGTPKQVFPSLKELVSKFKKPNQGLVITLQNPVKRTSPCLRWRRSKLDLEDTYGKSCHTGRKGPGSHRLVGGGASSRGRGTQSWDSRAAMSHPACPQLWDRQTDRQTQRQKSQWEKCFESSPRRTCSLELRRNAKSSFMLPWGTRYFRSTPTGVQPPRDADNQAEASHHGQGCSAKNLTTNWVTIGRDPTQTSRDVHLGPVPSRWDVRFPPQ